MIELLRMPNPDTPDIHSMTKAELLAFANQNGIEGVNSSMLKADILSVIEQALAEV